MPTFVFAGEVLVVEELLPEELPLLQPVSPTTSAATPPATATDVRGVVRMGCVLPSRCRGSAAAVGRGSCLARVMSGLEDPVRAAAPPCPRIRAVAGGRCEGKAWASMARGSPR